MYYIYKLKYASQEEATQDLLARGIQVEFEDGLIDGENTIAVVHIGQIVLEHGTYDELGKELTAPIFAEGHHVDLMLKEPMKFENEIEVNNPKHQFAGHTNNNVNNEI